MDRVSAVKVLPAALTLDRERATRFLREAAVLSRVQHENVVAVRNVGEDAGLYFIEMELVHGGSLAARLRGVGTLEIGEAIPLMKGVAAGLGAAHAAGIVHRDVKPGNILIDPRNEPKLVDFGLARASDQSQSLTGTGAVMGTPDFMSPEQCRGEPATPASDVYSFGVTFYRALAGRLPFEGGSPLEVIHKHLRAEPVPPSALVPDLPRPWSELVERCLAKDPRERFRDGSELLAAVEAVERGERLAYISRARRRRRRRLLAAAGAAGLLGAASWGAARGIEALRAPPPVPAAERLASHVARGRNLLIAGGLWEAGRELREGLALDPDHAEARRLLSVVRARAAARDALERGDPDGALRAAEEARGVGPDLPGAEALVAEAREALSRRTSLAAAADSLRAGDPDGARRALAGLPPGGEPDRRRAEADWLAKAVTAEEEGRFAEALGLWEKLALSDPASPVAPAGRAVALGLLGAAEHAARGESADAFARAVAVAGAAPGRASAARSREGYRRRLVEEARSASAAGDPARGLRLLDGLLAAAP
ncbi:MAG: protein kinase, partial [Planctomycetales bacterium]|nr:protein kinase [Planctomycetales bacterium]